MNDHERGFLEFVEPDSRRRLGALFDRDERGWQKLRDLLDHGVRLAPRSCEHLTGRRRDVAVLAAELRARGAPARCHVLSANRDLDGQELPLSDALAAVIGGGHGAFLSCLPGRLGLYEYEDMNSTFLLCR